MTPPACLDQIRGPVSQSGVAARCFDNKHNSNITMKCHLPSIPVGKRFCSYPKRNNDKGLLLIANHPFGVADGLSLGWIASKIDPNFKIIANGVLRQEPSLNRNILPIDFGLSRESMVVNIQTRKDAISYLKSGGVVAIFPAGQVSWAKKIGLPATDDDWKPLAGRLIKSSGCDVLPIKS